MPEERGKLPLFQPVGDVGHDPWLHALVNRVGEVDEGDPHVVAIQLQRGLDGRVAGPHHDYVLIGKRIRFAVPMVNLGQVFAEHARKVGLMESARRHGRRPCLHHVTAAIAPLHMQAEVLCLPFDVGHFVVLMHGNAEATHDPAVVGEHFAA
jgi:hypothetical protein